MNCKVLWITKWITTFVMRAYYICYACILSIQTIRGRMIYNVMRAYYLDQPAHQTNRGTPVGNPQHLQRYARESQKIRTKRPKSDTPITFWIGFRYRVLLRILYNNPQPPHISRKNFVSLGINCYPPIRRDELLWLEPNTEKGG